MPPTKSPARTLVNYAARAALLLVLVVSFVTLGQFLGISTGWATLAALVTGSAVFALSRFKTSLLTCVSFFAAAAIGYLVQTPSHDRDWIPEIAQLPSCDISGHTLSVENLRDFTWRSTVDFDENWIQESFELDQLETLDVIVVPFGDSEHAAHVMLSFGFADGRHLAVSVETRPEKGESYSLIGGATRQLELIYLLGTERDLLGLRILHRGNRVYSFPLRVSGDFKRSLLLELCESANQLREQPKFYATLRHNCTTTLLRHVNRLRAENIAFTREILFPAKLGQLLHRLGYLDTALDWPAAQAAFRVDERVRTAKQLEPFPAVLRGKTLAEAAL